VLTQNGCAFAPVLHAFGETAPKSLRLTSVTLDLAGGTATLAGYANESNAEVEVATFIRALDANKTVTDVFDGATLNNCQSSKRGNIPVKEFSISLKFLERFKKLADADQQSDTKESNGSKNRPKT
jgi:hypothetical protein